ncbi:hypothetical protein B0H15DRAFT_152031 [Mycena belliarum]|uniref:Uncharacterized protein n=1 Tax=Mycena belliarum TaxID=1033014 RepID=A0AAD6TL25_9AGAR|nr:hypothetical protein B0H15DRAFT_152031 [Mycena belliae]
MNSESIPFSLHLGLFRGTRIGLENVATRKSEPCFDDSTLLVPALSCRSFDGFIPERTVFEFATNSLVFLITGCPSALRLPTSTHRTATLGSPEKKGAKPTHTFLPHFRARKAATIVNTSSQRSCLGTPVGGAYCSLKAAVEKKTGCLSFLHYVRMHVFLSRTADVIIQRLHRIRPSGGSSQSSSIDYWFR